MAQPYIGEIRMFAGNFAPADWAFCDGSLLPISEYETLFNLIGTNYGGDGQETFALPDLRGRLPLHHGNGFVLAEKGGTETVTLQVQNLPRHTHPFLATADTGNQSSPNGNVLARSTTVTALNHAAPAGALNPAAIVSSGGGQPHSNVQPYLCVNFIISLFGIFPSPT